MGAGQCDQPQTRACRGAGEVGRSRRQPRIVESMRPDSIPAKWTPYILSITRIIFGFLIVRHGMEQWFGYPEASDYTMSSFSGIVELVEFPAGLLLMLGLFTRPIALLVSVMVGISYFTGP